MYVLCMYLCNLNCNNLSWSNPKDIYNRLAQAVMEYANYHAYGCNGFAEFKKQVCVRYFLAVICKLHSWSIICMREGEIYHFTINFSLKNRDVPIVGRHSATLRFVQGQREVSFYP